MRERKEEERAKNGVHLKGTLQCLTCKLRISTAGRKPRVNDEHSTEPRIGLLDSPAQGWVVVDPQGTHPDPEQCGGWLEERAGVRTVSLRAGTHGAQVILATATVAGCGMQVWYQHLITYTVDYTFASSPALQYSSYPVLATHLKTARRGSRRRSYRRLNSETRPCSYGHSPGHLMSQILDLLLVSWSRCCKKHCFLSLLNCDDSASPHF